MSRLTGAMTMGISEYDILTNTQPFAEDLGIVDVVEETETETATPFVSTDAPKNALPVDFQLFGFFDE